MPEPAAVQDHYPEAYAHCYGCGRLNEPGLHLRSRWDDDDVVASFAPRSEHTAMPGFVYGGLIASLIDCHAMATAAADAERDAGFGVGERDSPRFVTASLRVDYLAPTPHGPPLELRARVRERGARKAIVEVTLAAAGVVTARGEVVAVRLPATMEAGAPSKAEP